MEEIRITQNERGFTVYQGNKFCEALAWEEMLGQVISLAHPQLQVTDHENIVWRRHLETKQSDTNNEEIE